MVRQQQTFRGKARDEDTRSDPSFAKLKNANVSKMTIERPAKNARITPIHSACPGVVIERVKISKHCARTFAKMMNCEIASTLKKFASWKSMHS